jgi:hypothetical protein
VEKVWDNSLSTLINSNPQAFLDLILPGARCLHLHRTKLKGTQRQPDVVLEVERYSEIFLVNPEIQSYRDPEMAERLLLYHVLLWIEYEKSLPVRSCVISLFKQAKVAHSPLRWLLPGEPPGLKKERLSFCHMHDILRESPVYQWILTEGREEGEAKGLAKGVAQARQAVVEFVQEQFPTLAQPAEEVVVTIDNLAQLVRLTGNLGSAQSTEQARQILLDARQ